MHFVRALSREVTATCIAHTDTTIPIRVDQIVACVPAPTQLRVRFIEKPIGYPSPINWGGPGVTTITFGVSTIPSNVTVSGLTCGADYVLEVTPLSLDPNGVDVLTGTPVEITSACRTECATGGCTRTQGYWKNHAAAWPVTSLVLGTNGQTYSQEQLLAILRAPVRGNGLISLAHQLIAAKLNIAAGAGCSSSAAIVAKADALIGTSVIGIHSLSPSQTSGLVDSLDSYNNGNLSGCANHCAD